MLRKNEVYSLISSIGIRKLFRRKITDFIWKKFKAKRYNILCLYPHWKKHITL